MIRTTPSTPLRPIAVVAFVAALLTYVGCSRTPGTEPSSASSNGSVRSSFKPVADAEPSPAEAKEPAEQSKFPNWPMPAAALVISGEQMGYLEPCGCTKGQLGGLIRRYTLVEKLRAEKWPLALVELGGLIKDPASARGGPEQSKIKFATALKALTTLNYDALALSPEDLKLGVDEAVGQFLNMPGDRLKVVAANVVATGLEAKIVPSVRTKVGSMTIGITAVVDPEKMKAIKDPSLDLLQVKPIEDTLPAVAADLARDSSVLVLLVQGPPELARTLARKYPAFHVVVGTSALPDPPAEAEKQNGGKTLLVDVGQKGKYVGVVGIYNDPNARFRYQRVALDPKLDGSSSTMKAVIQDEFREALKANGVVENYPRHSYVGAEGATYIGAEACKSCHPNTFAKWSVTKHAQAFESLLHDPKPNVAFDAECVTCHTTGFEYTSGWKSPEKTPYLKGNQCENCHGPGSKHAEAPDDKSFRSAMHLTADLADKNGLCIRCHDEDNSPTHFDFAQRWGQIIHKGLDEYTDPKVHKGRTK
jgi:hypothetical protein